MTRPEPTAAEQSDGADGADSTERTDRADAADQAQPDDATAWHALSAEQTLDRLDSDAQDGLTADDAAGRLDEHGPNRLPERTERGPLARALAQLDNPLIIVLIVAGVVTLLLGHYVDAAVIVGVVVINAVIGFVQEGKAASALAAVRAMLATEAMVVRGGDRRRVEADELVPGDVVLLEAGDRVPADVRLVRGRDLRVEESALTGESVPVDKELDPVQEDASVGDRSCMAWSGTLVVSGQARGVVVETGAQTQVGRIGTMVGEVKALETPLTRRLAQLARQITVLILGLAVVAFVFAVVVRGMEWVEAMLVVVGMAVAAIPEGLPAVITIILAIGTRAMAAEHAIIRRLPAVETLGSVSVICTDKTGTLTRNEMTVTSVLLDEHGLQVSGTGHSPEGGFARDDDDVDPVEDDALQSLALAGLLCNDAEVREEDDGWTVVGDPTEAALVTLALKAGIDRRAALDEHPRVDTVPFSSQRRTMATLHRGPDGTAFVVLKGAPERVMEVCGGVPEDEWSERADAAAADGQRVLAVARTDVPDGTEELDPEDLPDGFALLGMVGITDPPRDEAVDAVAECRRAGVRVVMVTGDHAATAAAIGRELGMEGDTALTGGQIEDMDDDALREAAAAHDVVARASPEHKLRLVDALRAEGAYVAMTGDGVNDAPALKAADIGVAMGQRGTDAARDASDLVLTDDDFATIAQAVHRGRVVYDNIKKTLVFMLPTNGGQAGLVVVALLLGLTMPVTVGQILWVNMVTTVTLGFALAWEAGEPDVMDQPPRDPGEPLVTRPALARTVLVSVLLVLAGLAAFAWETTQGSPVELARTAAVNALALGQVAYLLHARTFTRSVLRRDTFRGNKVVPRVIGLLVVLQLLFTYAPPFQQVFDTAAMPASSWGVVGGLALVVLVVVEAEKALLRRAGVHRL